MDTAGAIVNGILKLLAALGIGGAGLFICLVGIVTLLFGGWLLIPVGVAMMGAGVAVLGA
jgi:hypothetical protein